MVGIRIHRMPTEVVVTLPPGPDRRSESRKQELVYRPGKTRVEVDLDGVAGTFEGETSASYSGPGIDGVGR